MPQEDSYLPSNEGYPYLLSGQNIVITATPVPQTGAITHCKQNLFKVSWLLFLMVPSCLLPTLGCYLFFQIDPTEHKRNIGLCGDEILNFIGPSSLLILSICFIHIIKLQHKRAESDSNLVAACMMLMILYAGITCFFAAFDFCGNTATTSNQTITSRTSAAADSAFKAYLVKSIFWTAFSLVIHKQTRQSSKSCLIMHNQTRQSSEPCPVWITLWFHSVYMVIIESLHYSQHNSTSLRYATLCIHTLLGTQQALWLHAQPGKPHVPPLPDSPETVAGIPVQ